MYLFSLQMRNVESGNCLQLSQKLKFLLQFCSFVYSTYLNYLTNNPNNDNLS